MPAHRDLSPGSTDQIISVSASSVELYSSFERWSNAQAKNAQVSGVIALVNAQGKAFHKAMNDSLVVASHGIDVAEKIAKILQRALEDNLAVRDQKALLKQAKERTQKALELARGVEKQFRAIQNELMEINSKATAATNSVQGQRTENTTRKSKAQDTEDVFNGISALLVGASIFWPVMLPLAAITKGVAEDAKAKVKDCQAVEEEFGAGIDTLKNLASGMGDWIDAVQALGDWFDEDVQKLERLEADSDDFKLTSVATIEGALVEGWRDDWKEVGERYTVYSSSIKRLGMNYGFKTRNTITP